MQTHSTWTTILTTDTLKRTFQDTVLRTFRVSRTKFLKRSNTRHVAVRSKPLILNVICSKGRMRLFGLRSDEPQPVCGPGFGHSARKFAVPKNMRGGFRGQRVRHHRSPESGTVSTQYSQIVCGQSINSHVKRLSATARKACQETRAVGATRGAGGRGAPLAPRVPCDPPSGRPMPDTPKRNAGCAATGECAAMAYTQRRGSRLGNPDKDQRL